MVIPKNRALFCLFYVSVYNGMGDWKCFVYNRICELSEGMDLTMHRTKEEYKEYAKRHAAPSPLLRDCGAAFLVGGSICALGQGFTDLYKMMGMDLTVARSLCSVTLIFIAVILSGFDIFDDIAKFSGAGTLVPITGFANAVVSPAIDNRTEGWILGVGAKLFSIAGPVIVYGISASVVYGVFYWIYLTFGV